MSILSAAFRFAWAINPHLFSQVSGTRGNSIYYTSVTLVVTTHWTFFSHETPYFHFTHLRIGSQNPILPVLPDAAVTEQPGADFPL
jgi:hypothetical protein